MIRVHVICEGQTEELFVNELLAPAFQSKHILLFPSLIGKPGHKGGNINFDRLFPDIRNRCLAIRLLTARRFSIFMVSHLHFLAKNLRSC